MTEMYCVKCRKKTTCNNVINKTTKNNRNMKQGNCSNCNTKCNQFIKGNNKTSNNVENTENINLPDIKNTDVDAAKNKTIKKVRKPRKTKEIINLLNPKKEISI